MAVNYRTRMQALKASEKALKNRRAIIKFDSGQGALLCNGCKTIIAPGFNHEDKEHYCEECKCKN